MHTRTGYKNGPRASIHLAVYISSLITTQIQIARILIKFRLWKYAKTALVQVKAWWRQQQFISWANDDSDLCHHMASLDQNGLNQMIPRCLQTTNAFNIHTTRRRLTIRQQYIYINDPHTGLEYMSLTENISHLWLTVYV